MIRQPTLEYTASLAPTFGGRGCVREIAVSAVLMAVSVVDAMALRSRAAFKAGRGMPHAGKTALIYVMESDRVSTLVVINGVDHFIRRASVRALSSADH